MTWREAAAIPARTPFLLSPNFHYDVGLNSFFLSGDMHVTPRPYLQRRKLLESLHLDTAPVITSPSWTDISADVVLDVVRDMGLEGLLVKAAASTYQPGRRSAAWIKSVVRHRSPMIVGGVGSLLLGAHNPVGELVYSGHVGTGLTDRARRTLAAALTRIDCPTSPFIGPALVSTTGRVNWVTPLLVVDVEYREFTGRLRHPSLKGLAGGVDPATVTLPQTP